MRGLYSGFDAARASWEFPEGTCAGFLGELKGDIEDVHNDDDDDCSGYPSDPVSDGLESTTGEDAADQKLLDNDQDTAVKVEFQGLKKNSQKLFLQISFSAAGLGGVRTTWDAVLWQDR